MLGLPQTHHNRIVDGNRLGDVSIPLLPEINLSITKSVGRTIGLIDVIWFSKKMGNRYVLLRLKNRRQ